MSTLQSHPRSAERVQGLGSAREGLGHWWIQRLTAVALIPLVLWLTASLIKHARDDYAALAAWFREPSVSVLMVLLVIALFYHLSLGLQVVAEDYIHSVPVRVPTVALIHLASFAM